ncbi:type VII secretion target [Mycobacterium sp. pUA109]|uniref:type VII secretion target n=1 Tax=Mycobacterium sp. pUA109 TaxID=3238982 RepID=UPI00351ACEAB
MGHQDTTRVDVAAMRAAANQFDGTAEILTTAVRAHLGGLRFDGASAGRAYVAQGDALRRAVDRLAAQLTQWSRASAEIALALRASADHYADVELYGAARIG